MKNFLQSKLPFIISIASMLLLTGLLRFNLYQTTNQFTKDFKSQNFNEIYSLDTLKMSSKLNAISSTVSWECIEGEIAGKPFFKMVKESCKTGLFQQKSVIHVPEANDVKITFTLKINEKNIKIYLIFLFSQILLIISLIITTKKNEEEKRLNEIKMNNLSRQMSHDIRSPLATLNSISENLQGKSSEDIKLLKLSIDRINQISNSLLEQGKEQTNIKIELIKTISNLVVLKKAEYKNAKINLKYDLNKNINIEGNLIEFERMFSNLVNNAIEASSNPIVEISLEILESKLNLSIKDNGEGIPKNVLEQIGKYAITTKEKGNGLGLSHAIKTAESFNAKINFESSSSGTTVSLSFQNFEIDQLNEAIKYVLVDDDQLVQLTWKRKAEKNKIDLRIFSSEAEFKNQIQTISKETSIYIDRELGQTNGEELAKFIFDLGYSNIYLATGHSPESFSHLTFLKGVIGKKPPF